MDLNDMPIHWLFAAVISFLFAAGFVLDILFFFNKKKWLLAGTPFPAVWRWPDLVVIVCFFFFFQQAVGMLFQSFFQVWPELKNTYGGILIWISNIIIEGAVVLFLLRYLSLRYGISLKELGLVRSFPGRSLRMGVIYYCGSLPILFSAGLLTKWIGDHWKIVLEPQLPMMMLKEETSVIHLIWISFFVVALAPCLEEIFFRGFIYPWMKKIFGMPIGMILSSLLFACIHFSFMALLPITCIGLFLAFLYEKTGSLTASIVFHAMNNLMTLLIVVFVLK